MESERRRPQPAGSKRTPNVGRNTTIDTTTTVIVLIVCFALITFLAITYESWGVR